MESLLFMPRLSQWKPRVLPTHITTPLTSFFYLASGLATENTMEKIEMVTPSKVNPRGILASIGEHTSILPSPVLIDSSYNGAKSAGCCNEGSSRRDYG